jgi:hypothetical protein
MLPEPPFSCLGFKCLSQGAYISYERLVLVQFSSQSWSYIFFQLVDNPIRFQDEIELA